MAREITIEAEWTHFRMLDIAANAPPVQVREMKKAFYAGAISGVKMVAAPESQRMSPENRRLMYIALLDEAKRWMEEFANTSMGRTTVGLESPHDTQPPVAADLATGLCEDCPPSDYPTDETRCLPCPRRAHSAGQKP